MRIYYSSYQTIFSLKKKLPSFTLPFQINIVINIMLIFTKHELQNINTCHKTCHTCHKNIIAFLYDPLYGQSITKFMIFPWSNRYHICLSAHNAIICLWLYWKLLRSNSFIWIHRMIENIYRFIWKRFQRVSIKIEGVRSGLIWKNYCFKLMTKAIFQHQTYFHCN